MTGNEIVEVAATSGWKLEFDWDSPSGRALRQLLESLTTARALRRAVSDVEDSIKKFEFQLESSTFELKKILRDEAKARADTSPPSSFSGLLTQREVARKLGISRAALLALSRDERFPEPIYVSSRKTAYRECDLDAWVRGATGIAKAPLVGRTRRSPSPTG